MVQESRGKQLQGFRYRDQNDLSITIKLSWIISTTGVQMRRRNRLMPKWKSLEGYSGELEILNFFCLDYAKFTHDMKNPGFTIDSLKYPDMKKAWQSLVRLSEFGAYLLSHHKAVPSALRGLTSLFGMERGGSPRL